jgi:hypothetical protein
MIVIVQFIDLEIPHQDIYRTSPSASLLLESFDNSTKLERQSLNISYQILLKTLILLTTLLWVKQVNTGELGSTYNKHPDENTCKPRTMPL